MEIKRPHICICKLETQLGAVQFQFQGLKCDVGRRKGQLSQVQQKERERERQREREFKLLCLLGLFRPSLDLLCPPLLAGVIGCAQLRSPFRCLSLLETL
jgi:hypothetical protein